MLKREEIIKILFEIGMSLKTKGFAYWIDAILFKLDNPDIKMTSLYRNIANINNRKEMSIERAMRTARESIPVNLNRKYKYKGNIDNETLLTILYFELKGSC